MRRHWIRGLLGALLFVGGTLARAADCPRPIVVTFFDVGVLYKPQSGGGLAEDVVEELFRRLGCRYEVDFQSRIRIWRQLADGQLDMTVAGISTPERCRFAYFIPYASTRNQLVYFAGTAGLESPEAALRRPDFRLGVVKGYLHGASWDAWIEQLRKLQRVEEAPDTMSLVRLLQHGRIQAFPATAMVLADLGQRYALDMQQIRQTNWFLDQPRNDTALVLSKARFSAQLAAEMEAGIAQMRNDGTLLKIYRRYLTETAAREMLLLH